MPCPAMACHDTHSRTQTGQPLWPGLISCHSRWSGDQGLLCGLLSDRTGPRRAPPDTDRTGTMCVCVCGGLGVHVREFDRDNENKEKKKKDTGWWWRVYQDECTHTPSQTSRGELILLQMWAEEVQCRCLYLKKFNYISVRLFPSRL